MGKSREESARSTAAAAKAKRDAARAKLAKATKNAWQKHAEETQEKDTRVRKDAVPGAGSHTYVDGTGRKRTIYGDFSKEGEARKRIEEHNRFTEDAEARRQQILKGGNGTTHTINHGEGALDYLSEPKSRLQKLMGAIGLGDKTKSDWSGVTSTKRTGLDNSTLNATEAHNAQTSQDRYFGSGEGDVDFTNRIRTLNADGSIGARLVARKLADGSEVLGIDQRDVAPSHQITEGQYNRHLQNRREDAMMEQMLANGGGEQNFDKLRRLERGWGKAKLRGLYGEGPSQAQVEARNRWAAKDAFSTYGNRNNAARDTLVYGNSDAFGKKVYGQMSVDNRFGGGLNPAYGTGASMFGNFLKNSEEMHKAEMRRRENEMSQNQQLINTLSGLSTALLGQTPPNQTPNANTVSDASKAAGAATPTQTSTVTPKPVTGLGQGTVVQEEQKQ